MKKTKRKRRRSGFVTAADLARIPKSLKQPGGFRSAVSAYYKRTEDDYWRFDGFGGLSESDS